jgi:methyl-accepting chemotaxis protein
VAGAVFMAFVAVTVLLIARAELAAERTEKAHAMVDAVWNMAAAQSLSGESSRLKLEVGKFLNSVRAA